VRLTPIVFALASIPVAANAHHSRVEFSGDTVEVEGELLAVRWINPHPVFRLRPSGSTSDVVTVEVYGSNRILDETGVDRSLIKVGDVLVVAGVFSNRRPNVLLGTHALLSSGLEAILQYNASPRWSGERVGGRGMLTIDDSELERASAENRGIFRVWRTPSTAEAVDALRATSPAFSQEAIAARENWDLTNNPITRCEPSWMPHVMIQPVPREFVDYGDRLVLNLSYFDSSRTIYLGALPDDLDRSPSRMGLSVGQWEGNTLVVETSAIDAPAYDGMGTLQSGEMRVVERFTLSENQAYLSYEAVITDPVALLQPVTFRLRYRAAGGELEAYSCD